MLDYFRKYFDTLPQSPTLQEHDVAEIDRSSTLKDSELTRLRVGQPLDPIGGWREPVKAPIWPHGHGPYPCISHYPGILMTITNMNRFDILAGILPSSLSLAYLSWKHGNFYNNLPL
jgi:hypothetical protein